MDDDYELVPKAIYESLKRENEMLKEQLKNGGFETGLSEDDDERIVGDLRKTFAEETQKERQLILEGIKDIKELNQHTLDNLINRTEIYEKKFDAMVDSFSDLIKSISNVIELLSSKAENEGEMEKLVDEMKSTLVQINEYDKSREIVKKLTEMEAFLQNLKVLLSYIKPGDIVTGR